MRFYFILLHFLFYSIAQQAQEISTVEKLQGYAQRGDQTVFIFDENLYDIQAKKVAVTGSFRNWSQDMEDKSFLLEKTDSRLWLLSVENAGFIKIAPLSQFKFRINEGRWMAPPANVPNEKGGNLEFLSNYKVPTLKSEIRKANLIWVKVEGIKRPLLPKSYYLENAEGKRIAISGVLPITASETLLLPSEKLDITRVYFAVIKNTKLKAFCSFDGWFNELYSNKELGANISKDGSATSLAIFAPRAKSLKLHLYKNHNDKEAFEIIDMRKDADGVWEAQVARNLKGIYYDFTVHGSKDPGNHFFETTGTHVSDPYARVNMNSLGKSRVWSKTAPASPLKNGIPKMEEVIAYEVHVQDFTDQLPVDENLKGTFPAMIKKGLRNSKGEKIGFDYLVDLGINTVHLMPVQEYLHYPDEEWKAAFETDPYMIDHGINNENYQWGYRTTHCMAVESNYRQKDTEPGEEREQFRDLVQAFHDEGIAVIIDIVPNHTGENMDGQHLNLFFNALDKLYYYRTKDFNHIGAFGNEVKTENRPMSQRWLIDQCLHFIHEFGIDGFRIDLAGQIDEQTLIALKEAIGHDKILYGEPWIGSNDPAYEANPDWDWYKEDSPITFFQDDSRNAFKGPVSNPKSKLIDRGWAGGNPAERENAKKGLSNNFPEDQTPLSGINYLDIHDNWALADQFASKDFDGRFGVDEDNFKIAATLLYTSLGPIVTHGGTEIMRSKGAAPFKEVVKDFNGVKIYLHGQRDTYNQRLANNFVWEDVGKTKKDQGSNADYKNMYNFWKGLNAFRKSKYGKVFQIAEKPATNYYRWIEPENKYMLGYVVDERVLVLLNSGKTVDKFEFDLPAGNWKLIGNNNEVNHLGIKQMDSEALKSSTKQVYELEPGQLKIWVKE